MLHPFVSSPQHEQDVKEHVGDVSISVVVHALLVLGAVVATSVSDVTTYGSAREIGRPPREQLRFVKLAPATPAWSGTPAVSASTAHAKRAPRLEMPKLPNLAPIAMARIADVVAPQIDFAQQTAQWAQEQLASAAASNNVITDVLRRMYAPAPANPNAVYTPDVVEKIASPRDGNPRPSYPAPMLALGIEASVRVQFVVDSTGRVDDRSLSFPATAQHLFVEAIKFALRHSRYLPAEFAGRRVPQVVSQEFVFRIER